jgi:Acetyltransferase (GNAT) domain
MIGEARLFTGYRHPAYAESLAEFGTPRQLPESAAWILVRQIPETGYRDAMGCYPLFACPDWTRLHTDLQEIGTELVSLSLVTDPFGDYDAVDLCRCFETVVRPFKRHFVTDLSRPIESLVSKHHRRNARKALQKIRVEICHEPRRFIDDWMDLYTTLIARHKIEGIAAFSKPAFVKQLGIPGLVMMRALRENATVGMVLWYIQGEVGYYHLGAYSPTGYESGAAFAIFRTALEYFADTGLRWLSLGAAPGTERKHEDGLSRFKSGWATGTRLAYLCGRVFDHRKYSELLKSKDITGSDYFPAYRAGEFT